MKISIRLVYIIGLIALLLTDTLFSDVLTGHVDSGEFGENPSPMGDYPRLLTAFFVVVSVALYGRLRGLARAVFWATTLATALLVLESMLEYGVVMVYPHVFNKVLILYSLCALYALYSWWGRITLRDLVGLIWVALALNLAFINYKALSLGSFVDHERGLMASSVYLLVLPLLYHFNRYLDRHEPLQLALFFLAAGAILFFQHRTVWIVSVVSLALTAGVVLRVAPGRLGTRSLVPLVGIPLLAASLGLTMLVVSHPEIVQKVYEDISDIENHDSQGTGGWRREQFRSYWPFVEEKPVLGMRFEGFELPIQFYDPDTRSAIFEDGHGHFLHSYYLDSLFYLGFAGLLLLSAPMLLALYQLLRRPLPHPEFLTWMVFTATSLVYGYSYSMPPYFYGLVGFGLLRTDQLAALARAASRPAVRPQPVRPVPVHPPVSLPLSS